MTITVCLPLLLFQDRSTTRRQRQLPLTAAVWFIVAGLGRHRTRKCMTFLPLTFYEASFSIPMSIIYFYYLFRQWFIFFLCILFKNTFKLLIEEVCVFLLSVVLLLFCLGTNLGHATDFFDDCFDAQRTNKQKSSRSLLWKQLNCFQRRH